MTNTQKFKAVIMENGLTQAKLAQKMGISLTTLNYKMNNKREFKVNEIQRICQLLDIKNINEIFFC